MVERPIGPDGQPLAPMPPPTAAFLEELRERVRRYGWSGDYTELVVFTRSLYEEAGVRDPDLRPYEWTEC